MVKIDLVWATLVLACSCTTLADHAVRRRMQQATAPSPLEMLQQQREASQQLLDPQVARGPSIARAPGASGLGDTEFEIPVAVFPLRTPGLQSLLGGYKGASNLASFTEDSMMETTTLQCGQDPSTQTFSKVTIPNVPFASGPSWTLIFWVMANQSLEEPQPLFAFSATDPQSSEQSSWAADQIKVILMGSDNGTVFGPDNQPGTLRAIVRANDTSYSGPDSITFLDSNGQTSNSSNTTAGGRVDDGQWHMITITSLEDGLGFQMFVDGAQAGILRTNATEQGKFGAPVNMGNRNIYLCTDPNIDPDSYGGFTGRMFELSLWNSSFSADDVRTFYLEHWTDEDAAAANATSPQALESDVVASILSPANSDTVDKDLLSYLASTPDPIAFFPLVNDLSSIFGDTTYTGSASNISWASVDPQGSSNVTALTCSKKNGSAVSLDPVEYGQGGAWAINLWFRASPSGLVGDQFEYLFSQQNSDQAYTYGWEANQVRMYFPQINHPAFGIIRAIVKDSSAVQSNLLANQSFLDTDGRVAQLTRPDPSNPAVQEGSYLLQGNQWHMLTLTSLVKQNGYALFLDGDLAGVLNSSTIAQSNLTTVEGDGGQPMNMTGNILLCARNSTGGGAYDGQISQLAIFNTTLVSRQVAALYLGFRDLYKQTALELTASPAPVPPPTGLRDRYNDQCLTPLAVGPVAFNGCVTFDSLPDSPVCWVADDENPRGGGWSQCASGSLVSVKNITTLDTQNGQDVRLTASFRECFMPTVLGNQILTDCIFDTSVQTRGCQMQSGGWAKCASRQPIQERNTPLVIPYAGQAAGFGFANRSTVSGKQCALPYMLNGTLWLDCIGEEGQVGPGGGQDGTCLTEDNKWERCASRSASGGNQTTPLLAVLQSTGTLPLKGAAGGLCIPDGFREFSGIGRGSGCQSGLTCVTFALDQADPQVSIAVSIGYCAQADKGASALANAFRPVNNATMPTPYDFFPLTGTSDRDLQSITYPFLEGRSSGASWTPDDMFESSLTCSRAAGTTIQLESSAFSQLGQWALNLWFKTQPGMSDTANETSAIGYLLSNTAVGVNASDSVGANQLHIYLPARNSKSFGVVRTIVKDSLDFPNAGIPTENHVYLDSDGQVNNILDGPKNKTDVNDGKWHMITLSTNYAQFAGYRFFLDGKLVAQLNGSSTAVTFPSQPSGGGNSSGFRIGGGAPILLNGYINLCGRADNAQARLFDGKLAHLALFNRFLTAAQIRNLYEAYTSNSASAAPGASRAAATPGSTAPMQVGAVEPPRSNSGGVAFGGNAGQGGGSKTNVGAIVGGVVGGLAGLALIAGLAYYFARGRSGSGLQERQSVLRPMFSRNTEGGMLEMAPSGKNPYVRQLDDVGFGGRPDQASPPVNGDAWNDLSSNPEVRPRA